MTLAACHAPAIGTCCLLPAACFAALQPPPAAWRLPAVIRACRLHFKIAL